MEYNYPAQDTDSSQSIPQQQHPAASKGRGRRQYAAQQYDFNAPAAAPPMYEQQQPYLQQQAYQQSQPIQQAQYGQPQTYPQQGGYQYGQEYQAPSPNAYPQGYPPSYQQGQPNVAAMTNSFQHMQVAQVDFSCLIRLTF
jgi:hypothetical protein